MARRLDERLVWHDEFDDGEIDGANWTYDIGGWGWGNGEAEFYTARPENARVQDGMLVIEARQEKFEGSCYTSARLKTQGLWLFQYGRFEARIQVPGGAGLWPAFWMLGVDFDGTNWPVVFGEAANCGHGLEYWVGVAPHCPGHKLPRRARVAQPRIVTAAYGTCLLSRL